MHRLIRTCLSAAAVLAVAFTLAACTISSDTMLVANSEGATPLPDSFALFPYDDGEDGYKRTSDGPATFVRDGNQYVSRDMPDTKGMIGLRFLPAGPDSYLMAATFPDEPGAVYGFARYADSVLSIALTPDKDTSAALEAARSQASGSVKKALDGLAISSDTDAITVKNRAALDYLVTAYAAGHLPLDKLAVAFIGPDATTAPPKKILQSGTGWTLVP